MLSYKIWIVLTVLFLFVITPCYAIDLTPDEVGIDYQYSRYLPNIVESKSHYHTVKRLTIRLGKLFTKHFKMDGELFMSFHQSHPKTKEEVSYRARELGVNLVGKYQVGNRTWICNPYIGWLAGLSWLIDAKNQPNWAESGILGTWGPVIGITIPINIKTNLKFEYRITHTSDPFGSDSGRNFEGVIIGITHYL